MRNYRIAVDSSANLTDNEIVSSIPLSLTLGKDMYVDDNDIDVTAFLEKMEAYKGKTTSACPSVTAWRNSFEGKDEIYCVCLTSKISGAYNSLNLAKENYLEERPETKILTIDTLTTGPELELYVEKIQELVEAGKTFEEITAEIEEYKKKTNLGFMLRSLENIAKNGRVNVAIAKLVKLFRLAIIGEASPEGELHPQNKCRGEKKGIEQLFENMLKAGYEGGKVRLAHTKNEAAALKLKEMIVAKYPKADITIRENKALCAYYTEREGLLVGYESKLNS